MSTQNFFQKKFLITLCFILLTSPAVRAQEARPFYDAGDVNGDGNVNIADVTFLLNHLFLGGPVPRCLRASDVNNDNAVDIADAVYLLQFLFSGGPALRGFPIIPLGSCAINPPDEPPAEEPRDFVGFDSPEIANGLPDDLRPGTHITCGDRSAFPQIVHDNPACDMRYILKFRNQIGNEVFVYGGCANDGKDDVISYGNFFFCGTGQDNIYAFPSHGLTGGTTIVTGRGDDLISGTSSNDLIMAGRGNNVVFANGGDDNIGVLQEEQDHSSPERYNIMLAGDGDDTITLEPVGSGCVLIGGAGRDQIHATYVPGLAFGGDGNDAIRMEGEENWIYGEDGHDELYGGSGDDLIFGDTKHSFDIELLVALDILFFKPNAQRTYEKVLAYLKGSPEYQMILHHQIPPEAENSGNDTIDGDYRDVSSYLRDNDFLLGEGGNDFVIGSTNNNNPDGNDGTDWLLGGTGDDRLIGGPGTDILYGGDGDDVLYGDSGGILSAEDFNSWNVVCGGDGVDAIHENNSNIAPPDEGGWLMTGPGGTSEQLETLYDDVVEDDIDIYHRGRYAQDDADSRDTVTIVHRWYSLNVKRDIGLEADELRFRDLTNFYVNLPDCWHQLEVLGIGGELGIQDEPASSSDPETPGDDPESRCVPDGGVCCACSKNCGDDPYACVFDSDNADPQSVCAAINQDGTPGIWTPLLPAPGDPEQRTPCDE